MAFSRLVAMTIALTVALAAAASPQVHIKNGTLVGSSNATQGVDTFVGIPFAEPPVGNLRLRIAQPITRTFGTLNVTTLPNQCPQFTGIADIPALPAAAIPALVAKIGSASSPANQREDCLYLSIQRPTGTTANARLPVVLWIHGGAYEDGSSTQPPSDTGATIVERSVQLGEPVIYVAIQYRLNGFGFLGGSDVQAAGISNLGLRDQRMALQWVHENIGAFGGDTASVTLFGESAGAWSVFNHLVIERGDNTVRSESSAYPPARLFHRAILASGSIVPAEAINSKRAESEFEKVVAAAGCSSASDKLTCLRHLPYEDYKSAVNKLNGVFSYESLNLQYLARPDPKDCFFPASPELALFRGAYARVPILIGDLEDEGTLFAVTSSNVTNSSLLVTSMRDYFQSAPIAALKSLVQAYPEAQAAGSPFHTDSWTEVFPGYKRLSAIIGDVFFTLTRRVVLHQVCREVQCWSWLGTFNHNETILGTSHGDDLSVVFQNATTNTGGEAGLLDYYLSFIKHSDPNAGPRHGNKATWPSWQSSRPQMLKFAPTGNSVILDTFRPAQYQTFRKLVSVLLH